MEGVDVKQQERISQVSEASKVSEERKRKGTTLFRTNVFEEQM